MSTTPSSSPLLSLPPEIRNRIYDFVFEDLDYSTLVFVVPKNRRYYPYCVYRTRPTLGARLQQSKRPQSSRNPFLRSIAALSKGRKIVNRPLAIKFTCRQIAEETRNYWFQRLDLLPYFALCLGARPRACRDFVEFSTLMTGRWANIRHLEIGFFQLEELLLHNYPTTPRNNEIWANHEKLQLALDTLEWPRDLRNVESVRIHGIPVMFRMYAVYAGVALHILSLHFPRLKDIKYKWEGPSPPWGGFSDRFFVKDRMLGFWYTQEPRCTLGDITEDGWWTILHLD